MNTLATSSTSVLSVTFCLSQGNVICPGEDFLGLPFMFIPASKRLPQWFFFSGFGLGRYFLQKPRYLAAHSSRVLPRYCRVCYGFRNAPKHKG
ncbi:MAG: hypothetical protein KME31_26090 [Tolypothrix carrinoi HA7290-LM1]|nr:hypothetical protein [Tolypothrix carrinoi HA7290-LM1]